jgi:hypothetical protein
LLEQMPREGACTEVNIMAVRALARIRWKGQDYFLDDRLGELRKVAKPWVIIPLWRHRAKRILSEGHCIQPARYLD